MSLFVFFILMLVIVVALLLQPLLKRPPALVPRLDYDMGIYREQLIEVDRDSEQGLLTPDQVDIVRNEIRRRALAADKSEPTNKILATDDFRKSRLSAALIIMIVVPLGTGAIYFYVGNPELPARPYAERQNDPEFILANKVKLMEAQLTIKPDAAGYERLGGAYVALSQYNKAVDAFQKALAINHDNADLWADLGETIGLGQDGVIGSEASAAFSQCLRLDPKNPRARFYMGLAEAQKNQPRQAVAIWRDLEQDSAPDSSWLPMLKKKIEIVSKNAGFDPEAIAPTAPTLAPSDAAAAIMSMSTADQGIAIRGMVDRLAARLKDNPDDLEGWERLEKSYQVLGETEKAKDAESRIKILKAKEKKP